MRSRRARKKVSLVNCMGIRCWLLVVGPAPACDQKRTTKNQERHSPPNCGVDFGGRFTNNPSHLQLLMSQAPIAAFMPVAQEFDRVSVAVFDIAPELLEVFRDCFKDFRVAVQFTPLDPASLGKNAIDACILRLDAPQTPELLAAIRRSDLQKRCVIFGVGTQQQAIRLSEQGINALVEKNTAREILSAIRVTYLLLVHRLRRHVRIPLVLEVEVQAEEQTVHGITRDISAGGLNMTA